MVINVNKYEKEYNKFRKNVNGKKIIRNDSSYNEEYDYDFIPNLNQWLNIDEQKKKVKRLENIDK